MQEMIERNGVMLDLGVVKFMRDASLFLHRDATVDISRFKIVKPRGNTPARKINP